MSSHIVTLNTQEVRERNKNRNDKPKEIEQRNPFYDQGQSLIRSSLMKLQQEEINTYEFKYFSNKPKKVFSTSFSISLRNDILRFSGEDTLFTPTFLGKRMTEDESSDESSEEGTKIIIEVGSSSDEEEEFAFNETEVDGRPIMEAMDYSSTSGSDEEESEEEGTSESDEETISRTSRKRTLDERVTYPTYDRDSFKFTPIQTSEELYQELTLKDYQLEAINFLFNNYCENRPSCLAHEMGLGKTIISLSTLNIMYKKLGVFGPFLIVVPLITLPNWEREAKKWLPQFKCHTAWGTAVNGTKAKALEDTSKLYSESVSEQTPLLVLTTYEFLKETTVTRKKWACVIFDEAHKLKSQKTQARKNAEKLKKEYFFLLTGTPMQNSPEELWSLLNLLDPRAFPSYKLFEEKYGELETETAITNLKTAIAPYLIRKTKAQVLHAEMPPKEEILIEIELSSIQKSVYRAIVERKVNFFRKQFASKQDLTYIVNSLRYCCNHPCLISGMEEYLRDEQKRDDKGILIYSSSKMVVVHKLLKKFRDANEKTLILSQFLEMLDVLESYLQSEQISYVRIDGSCPSEERQRYIDKFQTDSECRVFLLSTKISQGINLTAANHVIIYDSDFNPFNDSQAAARAHRIGQTKKVFVYRLVTKDSYEKYIISRASKKLGREKLVLAESDKSDEDITAEEMQRMIKYGVYSLFLNKEQNINKDNELMNTDIDKILERSSKIGVEGEEDGSLVDVINRVTGNDKSIEKQTSNEVIKSVYFVPVEEVSDVALDDPNFWDKTFPDYCDIYTLESRLENVKPFEAHEFESYFKKLVHVATESINRRQKVSEETEKLSRVVEEDKRGLPTKNQLHTFLLKLNSQRYNHHYHSLQKDHLDQVQKWIDQLETKTLRNKKVWASSSDNIKKQEKRSSSNVNDHLDSDAEFDGSDSDDGDNTDDEFECDQNELVRESESLHNINIKTAPPKKKQKTTRSNRGIREKSSENESERPHKKPTTHKKELKFEKSQVSNHLPPPTTRQDTMKQQPTTGFWPSHMQNTPLQLFHPVEAPLQILVQH
ncbi:predicted protein [Naegleria gruberi]|uniref:Predicted protein n=1 Tax=Naegleria gruberi TaxID=5762 RepID=D2VG03_NAEGR|nr:uncharacterized protein NAEGRDRAFT_67807 [Naegleria gruberi]EFC44174.1 predicted protein [Naegleria gruberi]|eukprot:XP_002676918.1 predicted protein [Naegleria gruberi strain NEG-M]